MSDPLVETLQRLAQRLAVIAAGDDELRTLLHQLVDDFIDSGRTERHSAPSAELHRPAAASGEAAKPGVQRSAERTAVKSPRPARSEPLPELTLGRSTSQNSSPSISYPANWRKATHDDLATVETRCRLKADGARWAARRSRLMAEGANYETDIEPRDREIIAQAKATPNCYLWMCHPSGPSPRDLRKYDRVAVGFDNLAEILSLVRQIEEDATLYQNQFGRALDLLAEAQSALRVAIDQLDGPGDSDQVQAFQWLKATAAEHQVFIKRHMRVDDPADPNHWEDLAGRIEALDAELQDARRRTKQRHKLLGKVRHKVSLFREDPAGIPDHFRILVATVEQLIEDGLPPSNRELRDYLLPIVDAMPELHDPPPGFQMVLREIDRFLATNPAPKPPQPAPPSAEVRQVAELLSGQSVVLIGGERRAGSQQSIEQAFDLDELVWIETREHQSIEGFEAAVARPEVAVVLLAIRWSSHSYGDVQTFCDQYGKPLVRLPAGYNPNQIAAQILNQCSDRLRETLQS